jgi:hypothetical protein
METGEGASVYAEAKGEYSRQLCQFLVPAIHKYFLEILEHAKELEPESKKQLLQFQTLLEGISEWNVDKVQRETQRILITTQCDYIEELLTAVFIAHTKVLSSIRLTNKQKKLQITIPKLEHFLHRTLTECARHLWTNTFLFSSSYSPLERQKNMRQVEGLISEGVLQGVRTMLPVKSILKEYLSTEDTESEYETGSEGTDSDESESEDESEAEVEPASLLEPEPKAKPVFEPTPKFVSEPTVLKLDSEKAVSFSEKNTIFSVGTEKTVDLEEKKSEEELLFIDTDDIGFNDEEVKTEKIVVRDEDSFEFEELL